MVTQTNLTHSVNGSANGVSSETTPEGYRSGEYSNTLQAAITQGFNTQLLTHYGYYLSTRPTIQQLKK